jgi:hypothetical protein
VDVRLATKIGVKAAQTALIQNVTVARGSLHIPTHVKQPATRNIQHTPLRTPSGCAANAAARSIVNGAMMFALTAATSSVLGALTCRAGMQGWIPRVFNCLLKDLSLLKVSTCLDTAFGKAHCGCG